MKKIVCNLKTAFSKEQMENYVSALSQISNEYVSIIVAPSYPFIDKINKPLIRASQDISIYDDEYAVGEVTSKTLKTLNVEYVMVGHSDRKFRFKESEIEFIKKINNAINNQLKVIYCIGETREEKARCKTLTVLEKQIARVFNFVNGPLQNIIIAYEPIWAISTNKNDFENINVSEISETISFIKRLIKDYYNEEVEVIYGGSVSGKNIDQYRNLKSDGLLIGKSSLEADEIKKILSEL